MKRALLLVVAVAAITALRAQASLLLYEGFDYASGSLVGGNGGSGFSSAWQSSGAGGVTVATPGFTYTDSDSDNLQTVGGYAGVSNTFGAGAYRTFSTITAASGGTTTYWVSVLMNTSGAPYGISSDTSIIQLRNAAYTNLVSVGAFGTNASFRTRGVSGNAATTVYSGTTGVANSSNLSLVVLRIDVNTLTDGADAIYMWLDPDLSSEPLISGATSSITGTNLWNDGDFSLTNIRFGVENSGTEEAKGLNIDEFRLGTDFASVAVVVPEPSALALGAMSLLAWGAFGRRRQRAC